MKSGVFFPYSTSPDGISLSIIPGPPATANGLSVDAWSDEPDLTKLALTIRISLDKIKRLLPTDESVDSLRAWVRISSTSSRQRQRHPISLIETQDASLELRRDDWTGSVTISCVITRHDSRAPSEGLAADRGAVLAWSDDWVIHFDPPVITGLGTTFPVQWINFKESDEFLSVQDHLFVLREEGEEGLPEIVLNSGFVGAHPILTSKGTRGRNARIRDSVFSQIGHQAWTSVLGSIVIELGATADELMDPSGWDDLRPETAEWKASVVDDWAPFLFPEVDRAAAADRVAAAAISKNFSDILIARIPSAIQRRLKTYRSFTGMVDDIKTPPGGSA